MAETAVAAGSPQKLDDIMIAMDVVDTLRHCEDLVRRELNAEGREADLVERLRQIYREQGIEVPDRVLADGVKALKESRFVYEPPAGGWKRSLFTLWAMRDVYGKRTAAAVALIVAGVVGYHFLVTRPARLAEERARIEVTETLPKALRRVHADVLALAADDAAKQKAAALLADGEQAIRGGNRTAIGKVTSELATLKQELAREYTLTIVSRVGEPTGVWRRPPGKSDARNYYLIVEAIAPDGRKLALPIRNEENGVTETVAKFGVRVPRETYDAVAQDKRDDGIVQRNVFGTRKRGRLATDYQMPFQGGFITKW
jgi:hypothetical protein